jgi:NADH-quinone oxidoreductase subunit H
MSWELVLVTALQFGVPFLIIFVFVVAVMLPLMIYMERKVGAYMQDRRGPNRASIAGFRAFGLVHLVADVLKLLFKEDVEPTAAERFTFRLAPLIVMAVVLVIMAVLPFGEPIDFGDIGNYRVVVNLQAVNLPAGIVFIFAFASLEVYGLILGGWSAANKYSFLGAVRGASQMISYELTLGLAVIGLLVVYETTDLYQIVRAQGANPLDWGVVLSLLGFLLFLVASYAETNRTPFDLTEAEAEVVAGYHLEYSSFKFALFFMGEYVAMVVSAAVLVTLFLGGWQVPFLDRPMLESHAEEVVATLCILGAPTLLLASWATLRAARRPKRRFGDRRDREPAIFVALFALGGLALAAGAAAVLGAGLEFPRWLDVTVRVAVQAGSFMAKTFFFSFAFIWVRWTLPRFRYDQLMRLGWQWMLPLGVANVLVTVLWADAWTQIRAWIVEVL